MRELKEFENYIFDLDGTLIDSMSVWDNIGYDFLLSKGINPPDDLNDRLKTMSFEEAAEYFIKELKLNMPVPDIIKGVTETAADKYRYDIPLKPYVFDFIKKSADGNKRMCILTASEEYYVVPLLKRLNIDKYFEKLITCTSISMSKSSFEIYQKAADIMGFDKGKTAVFEDAYHGIVNSKKAGFFTVAVYDSKEEENIGEIKKISDTFIMSFKELL